MLEKKQENIKVTTKISYFMIVIVDNWRSEPVKSIQMPTEKRINIICFDELSRCTLPLTTSSASIYIKRK